MIKRLLLALLLVVPASADSLLDPSQANLFGPKQLKIGDLVTVSIIDRVQNTQTVDVKSDSNMNVSGPLGDGALALLGTGLGLSSEGSTGRKEASVSKSEFSHTVTARIVQVEGDQLVLEAKNRIEVDGKLREVSLRGRVRRQDVNATTNQVASDRIADAEVFVEGANSSPAPGGIMSWILGILR